MTGVSLGLRSGRYLQQQLQNGSLLPTQSPPVTIRKPAKMSLSGSREKERILVRICKFAGRRKVGMLLSLIASVTVISSNSVVWKDEDGSASSDSDMGFTDQLLSFVNPGRSLLDKVRHPFILEKDTMVDTTRRAVHESGNLVAKGFAFCHNESGNLDFHMGFADPIQNFVNPNRLSVYNDKPADFPAKESKVNNDTSSMQNSAAINNITELSAPMLPSTPHLCELFSLPPPIADKKCTGPRSCPVCYVPVEQAVLFMPPSPSPSPLLKTLNYVSEDNLIANESNGGSIFGGHPSLQERIESFNIKESMIVYCGFTKGKKLGQGTGFDIDKADLLEMEECHDVVVASAIFGNYDIIQQSKNVSDYAKRNAWFYMFVDEETETYIKISSDLVNIKRVGLWRVVVVQNLPYVDARRNGKIPKLPLHKLFPNARFSLWIDGKLELCCGPLSSS